MLAMQRLLHGNHEFGIPPQLFSLLFIPFYIVRCDKAQLLSFYQRYPL